MILKKNFFIKLLMLIFTINITHAIYECKYEFFLENSLKFSKPKILRITKIENKIKENSIYNQQVNLDLSKLACCMHSVFLLSNIQNDQNITNNTDNHLVNDYFNISFIKNTQERPPIA